MEICKMIHFFSYVIICICVQTTDSEGKIDYRSHVLLVSFMKGNAECWISPPLVLNIVDGSGPGLLTCIAPVPCQNIADVYFQCA